MLHRCMQEFTSLLLVVVILMAPTFCLCQEINGEDHLRIERSQAAGHGSIGNCDQSPCCPGDDDAGGSHDASGCFCSCHLPVTVHVPRIHHVPLVGDVSTFEPFTALPEVYLSKFIPPQNQA